MKRSHLLILLILTMAGYISGWFLTPQTELSFLVVDKTVPEQDYREHRALFWLARHYRIVNPDGEYLQADTDYLGYHPRKDRKDVLKSEDTEDINLLYLADTYGVYDYKEGLHKYEEDLQHEIQPIELIYGGFTRDEVEIIKQFADTPGNLLVGEHNIYGSPTYVDLEAAEKLENIFGVSYTGWLVRYFPELSEVAFFIKEHYNKIYGQEWNMEGPGMVLVKEDYPERDWYSDIIIIPADGMTDKWPRIYNSDASGSALKGASDEVPYLYWMEVLEAHDNSDITAFYHIPASDDYKQLFLDRGVPLKIPAVISYLPDEKAQRIYFAGDFADQLSPLLPARLTGSIYIQRVLTYFPGVAPEYQFFFRWYAPVMKNIYRLLA